MFSQRSVWHSPLQPSEPQWWWRAALSHHSPLRCWWKSVAAEQRRAGRGSSAWCWHSANLRGTKTLCSFLSFISKSKIMNILWCRETQWCRHERINEEQKPDWNSIRNKDRGVMYLCYQWWQAHCVDGTCSQRWLASAPRELGSVCPPQRQNPEHLETCRRWPPGVPHPLRWKNRHQLFTYNLKPGKETPGFK